MGVKLFVSAESSSGYTIKFNIYTGKTATASEHGLSYYVVMNLIQPFYLGAEYHGMSSAKKVESMANKDFIKELVCQLSGTHLAGVSLKRAADHVPVQIITATGHKATKGRVKCKRCLQVDNRSDTPWKCSKNDSFNNLCFSQ